jgi:hypothetical protein
MWWSNEDNIGNMLPSNNPLLSDMPSKFLWANHLTKKSDHPCFGHHQDTMKYFGEKNLS